MSTHAVNLRLTSRIHDVDPAARDASMKALLSRFVLFEVPANMHFTTIARYRRRDEHALQ